jgi:RNA polymerase sigma-70 factor, ECF subfamily
LSDLDLARRVLAGDESAFDEFFAAYFPRLHRFARLRLGANDDSAEDVVQATLIKALDKLHTYRGEAPLFTWLCTFCRREISGWYRRAGRHAEVSLEDERGEARGLLDPTALPPLDDPAQALDRRELTRLVHATLDLLPGNYADALEWKYIEGLSVAEIAERLGLGYKATESLLTRARQAFREQYSLAAAAPPDGPSTRLRAAARGGSLPTEER